ncbi:hypothetical protein [Loigolactobacillus rennini]|uniref:Uncharacterized protein n=1 Tax=Loigolactobacillus rennini DSM 20253 TaxID=1423796 RepID=A0A0R2CXT5_9LACO|nr:hypothetical protein [Loigolactobacillus rennini]KRM92875.1 hypothetical protein FC24_GL000892 [Loigolactobacillus rennini DSM 20253]
MKYAELKKLVEATEENYYYVGVRFEDREYNDGDIVAYSKDNPDRQDERDFPEFGTPEYDDLPELDGSSAWYIDAPTMLNFDTSIYIPDHAYVIASNEMGGDDNYAVDYGEILIKDAIVIKKLW